MGMPHGDGDDDLLVELEDVLAHVQHDAERVWELLRHEMQGGPMPVIWEVMFVAAGWAPTGGGTYFLSRWQPSWGSSGVPVFPAIVYHVLNYNPEDIEYFLPRLDY
jgi:hypothetical protein